MTTTTCSERFSASHRQQLRTKGYFVTDVAFDDATISMVRRKFEAIWEADKQPQSFASDRATQATQQGKRTFQVRGNLFPVGLHRNDPELLAFCKLPVFAELSRALIGPEVDLCWSQAIIKPPHTGGHFSWHQDARYAITEPLDPGFTCWLAVTRTTIANGTLWVAPPWFGKGLLPHDWDDSAKEWQCRFNEAKEPPEADRLAVELAPGQMLVFSRLMPHASGRNQTNGVRMAFQIAYTPPGMVRTDNGQPLGEVVPLLRGGQAI